MQGCASPIPTALEASCVEQGIDIEDAVSYRIPQFVTEVLRFKDGNEYPVCPRCEITLDREYQAFCDRCGQALSWELFGDATIYDR